VMAESILPLEVPLTSSAALALVLRNASIGIDQQFETIYSSDISQHLLQVFDTFDAKRI
jgi:hypothetical protein